MLHTTICLSLKSGLWLRVSVDQEKLDGRIIGEVLCVLCVCIDRGGRRKIVSEILPLLARLRFKVKKWVCATCLYGSREESKKKMGF